MPKISGSNIMITNCRFTSFPFDGPGNLNIDAYYRNIDGVCLEGVNLDFGAHDGFDGGRQLVLALERLRLFGTGRISNVTGVNSIVHGMDFPPDSKAHGDAMQVRGSPTCGPSTPSWTTVRTNTKGTPRSTWRTCTAA